MKMQTRGWRGVVAAVWLCLAVGAWAQPGRVVVSVDSVSARVLWDRWPRMMPFIRQHVQVDAASGRLTMPLAVSCDDGRNLGFAEYLGVGELVRELPTGLYRLPRPLPSIRVTRDTLPLTGVEQALPLLVQRVVRCPGMGFVAFVGQTLAAGFRMPTSLDPERPSLVTVGNLINMLGHNDVEGWRMRLDLQTTRALSRHWQVGGYVKYGVDDQRWKGKAEVTYRPAAGHKLTAQYVDDTALPQSHYLTSTGGNPGTSLRWTTVRHMNYARRASLRYDLSAGGLRMAAQMRRGSDEAAGRLAYVTAAGDTASRIDMAEGTVAVRYLPRRRHAPQVGASHTAGAWSMGQGWQPSHFTEASLTQLIPLGGAGHIDCTVTGTAQWSRVPFTLLCMPAANLSYLSRDHTFRLVSNMEFVSDRQAALMLGWEGGGGLLGHWLGLHEAAGANLLWGWLTAKNADGPLDMPTMCCTMTAGKPYAEAYVGVRNILRVAGVEYVHRLDYISPGTRRWGVRLLLNIDF